VSKPAYILAILLIFSVFLYAQQPVKPDTIVPGKGTRDKQLKHIKEKKIRLHSESTGNEPEKSALIDTTIQNKYGDLLNDDPEYNPRQSLLKSAIGVPVSVFGTWAAYRYLLKAEYARVGIKSWENNLKKEWAWNNEPFGKNFIGNPYVGTLAFNDLRSNGYNYYESFSFAVAGGVLWDYFCVNTRPPYNDIINNSINGAFLGEIFYRISSNILDDRTRGRERVFREIFAGLIDPKRGINRLIQGKSFRITNKEVYQKEPLNISLYAGGHRINGDSKIFSGNATYNTMINLQLDYGNPFEIRTRKPFDFFKASTDFSFGIGKRIIDNVSGYGILFGKNMQLGKLAILIGGFQYYDFWNNKIFELGAIGFGGGLFSKLPLSKTSNLYTNIHLALIPFAGNSTQLGPEDVKFRDYNFGDGLEGKIESTINLGKYATVSLIYYYFLFHTYVGTPGNNIMGILKPRITILLDKDISIGFEQYVYYEDPIFSYFPATHSVSTEEKVFLLLYLEHPQRKGHYN
jgi:hypothetical protein